MRDETFRERVLPNFAFFVMLLSLPLAIWTVFIPINSQIGILIASLSYLTAVALAFLSSPVITVSTKELRVGSAFLPLAAVAKTLAIAEKDSIAEKGIKLHARAFTRFQVGVKGLVKIELNDKNDPTPYWLVSVRKSKDLVSALDANRAGFGLLAN